MMLFVDTSVWSLALRRDARAQNPEVEILTPRDRILLGLWSLLLRPARLHKVAMAPPIAPTRPPRSWSQSADHIGDPLDVRERLGVLEPRPLDPQQQVVDTEDLDVAL